MTNKVDLFDSTYSNFHEEVQRAVREETFLEDIGQNSWLTADELRRFIGQLGLGPDGSALDVACGAGGPALFVARTTGCRVTGVEVNEHAIPAAAESARAAGLAQRAVFLHTNASAALPFPDASFDSIICIDSILHFVGRPAVLADWRRVLKPGGRALYTDPLIVSGMLTNEEIAIRSSIGLFHFMPIGENEKVIRGAGFELGGVEDVTENAAVVAGRWWRARANHEAGMVQIEGAERFAGLQRFFAMVEKVSIERRLSRYAYLLIKP